MTNRWVDRIYNGLNVYERNVFGYFFDIHWNYRTKTFGVLKELLLGASSYLLCKWQRYLKKDIYFKYIEVPITTKCSLNCKECNNLIQYYQQPKNSDAVQIIKDIRRICSVTKRIKLMRILGGEPLVHPDLLFILKELKKIDKIEKVEVVTNGTLLFSANCVRVLKHSKFSVDISNYGTHSSKYVELIRQLDRNHIRYHTQKEQKSWKALSSCRCRERSDKELKEAFSACMEDCHSLLNGELHICARSAHGTDLGLFEKRSEDYVCVYRACRKSELKKQIFAMLNKKMIAACNYCDMFQIDKMETIPSAEQITKLEANNSMEKWKVR